MLCNPLACFACIHKKNSYFSLWPKLYWAPHLCLFYKWCRWCNLPAVRALLPMAQQCNKPTMPLAENRVKSTLRIRRARKITHAIKKKGFEHTTKKNQRKCVLKEKGENSALEETWSGDYKQMVQDQVQVKAWLLAAGLARVPVDPEFLESNQKTWPERQDWSAAQRHRDKLPSRAEAAGRTGRKKETGLKVQSAAGEVLQVQPRLLKSPAEARQQKGGKRCDAWPNRRKSDDGRVGTVANQHHNVILNYSLAYEVCVRWWLFQPSCRDIQKHCLLLPGPTSASKTIDMMQIIMFRSIALGRHFLKDGYNSHCLK